MHGISLSRALKRTMCPEIVFVYNICISFQTYHVYFTVINLKQTYIKQGQHAVDVVQFYNYSVETLSYFRLRNLLNSVIYNEIIYLKSKKPHPTVKICFV